MGTSGDDALEQDEDRLPWLETVEEDYEERPPLIRVALLVLIGLAVIAAAIFGYYWFQSRPGATGPGELIQAQEGDYKVKPDEPGGMEVEGQGDTVFATSEGDPARGSLDLDAIAEKPIDGTRRPATESAPGTGTKRVVAEVPKTGGTLSADTPARKAGLPADAGGGGGSLVQLGSFPEPSGASTAWDRLSKRFSYLAPLGKSVEKAEVDGRTTYRLRVNAGSHVQAKQLCAKLKVAGEACFVTR